MARTETAYEKPFGGFPKMKAASPGDLRVVERATVRGVDTKTRTVRVEWNNHLGTGTDLKIWSDVGNYSLPESGDVVICVIDGAKQPMVIGFCELNFDERLDGFQIPEALHGERLWTAKRFGQRLHFRNDGSVQLLTNRDEGFEVIPTQRVRALAPDLWEVMSNAGRMMLGVVRRYPKTGIPLIPAPDEPVTNILNPGFNHNEFTINVPFIPVPPPGTEVSRAARISLGTGVIDDRGVIEASKSLGDTLRGVLEIFPLVGGLSPIAYVHMTETGQMELGAKVLVRVIATNAELIGTAIASVKAPLVEIGANPSESPILGNAFLAAYNSHTHIVPQAPAGVLPSSTPVTPAPPTVLSQTIKISP